VAFPVTGDRLTSGLLFPFSDPYTIDPDSCSAADSNRGVANPARFGSAPLPVSATVGPGTTRASAAVRLPAMNIKVTTDGTPDVGPPAAVRVTTSCGTVYQRTTIAGGWIDDPGFPLGSSFEVCVSDGVHRQVSTRSNLNFNASDIPIDIKAAIDPAGTCA
jgi:hypothetical protein